MELTHGCHTTTISGQARPPEKSTVFHLWTSFIFWTGSQSFNLLCKTFFKILFFRFFVFLWPFLHSTQPQLPCFLSSFLLSFQLKHFLQLGLLKRQFCNSCDVSLLDVSSLNHENQVTFMTVTYLTYASQFEEVFRRRSNQGPVSGTLLNRRDNLRW